MFEVFGLGADFVFNSSGTSEINTVSQNLDRLHQSMRNGNGNIQQYSNALNTFSNTVIGMGSALAGAGIADTISDINNVMEAASWQDQMIDATRYMSDVSTKAQIEYNQALTETARAYGKAKEEINAATISYMQMGKSTEDSLRLVENASFAATTWDMSADTISEAFRSIKSSWKVNMEDQDVFDRYVDVINEVGNTTSATSADIVNFLDMAGGALATVGKVSLDNAISMVSAARYANLNVGEFGTAMQTLMNRYASKGADYFAMLGLDIKDATGDLIPFNEAIDKAAKNWDKYSESQKQAFLSSFGMYHASTLGKYIGAYSEQEKAYAITQDSDRYNGSAQKEFERVTDTFNFALSQMKVTLSDFKTAIWQTLLPAFTTIVRMANKVMTSISNFVQAHPALAKTIATVSLLSGVFVALAGATLVVIGLFGKFANIMMNINPITTLANALRGANEAMGGFGSAIRSVLPTIKSGILRMLKFSATIGLLYATWKYDFFNIRTMVTEFTTRLKANFNEMKTLLSADISVSGLTNGIQKLENSNSVLDRVTAGFTKFGYVIKGVSEAWNDFELSDDMYTKLKETGLLPLVTQILLFKMRMTYLFEGIKEGFLQTRDAINQFVKEALGPVIEWFDNTIIQPLLKHFPELEDGLAGFFSILNGSNGDKANQDFKNLGVAIGEVLAVTLMLSSAFKVLKVAFSVISLIAKGFSGMATVIRGVISVVSFLGRSILNILVPIRAIVSGAIALFGDIGAAISLVAEGSATVAEAFGLMGGVFGNVVSFIATVLGVIGGAVIAIAGAFGIVIALPAELVGAIVVAVVACVALIVKFKDQIISALGIFFGWLGSVLSALPGLVGRILGTILGTVLRLIVNVVKAIINFVTSVPGFLAKIPSMFFALCGSIWSVLVSFGNSVVNFFTVNIPNFFSQLPSVLYNIGANAIKGFWNGVTSFFGAIKKGIYDFCGEFVDSFKDALGIHSPSTVMYEVGGYTSEGFIDGMGAYSTDIYNAGFNLATTSADGVSNGVQSYDWKSAGNSIGIAFTNGMNMSFVGQEQYTEKQVRKALSSLTTEKYGSDAYNSAVSLISSYASGLHDNGLITDSMYSTISSMMQTLQDDSLSEKARNESMKVVNSYVDGIITSTTSNTDAVKNVAKELMRSYVSQFEVDKVTGRAAANVQQTLTTEVVDAAISALSNNNMGKQAYEDGAYIIQRFINGIDSSKIDTTMQKSFNDALKVLEDPKLSASARQSATNVVKSYIEGIDTSAIENSLADAGKDAIDFSKIVKDGDGSGFFQKYEVSGQNMVNGFVSGILANKAKAEQSSEKVMTGVEDYMGFNSPSRKGPGTQIVIWGKNMVSGFSDGMNQGSHFATDSASQIMQKIQTKFDDSKSKSNTWGSNFVRGFADGIRNNSSLVVNAAKGLMEKAKDYVGFNSPSKKGEGRNIVKWGQNMVGGFVDGIYNKSYEVEKAVSSLITAPSLSTNANITPIIDSKALSKEYNASMPIASELNSTISSTVNSDVMTYISSQIGVIIQILSTLSNTNTSIGGNQNLINTDYAKTTKDKIDAIYSQVITNNSNQSVSIVIEKGAIENTFKIEDGTNSNELIELITSIMDDQFLPLLKQKMEKLKIVKGE